MVEFDSRKCAVNPGAQAVVSASDDQIALAPFSERCALSLLSDPSVLVRRGAAEHLCVGAKRFSAIPHEVVSKIFSESDVRTVSSLVSFVAAANDPEGVAAPVCGRLLADERVGVAVDAAIALGDIAANSSAPLVPMAMLACSTPSLRDLRVRAFDSVGHLQAGSGGKAVRLVERCMQASEKAQRLDLKESCIPGKTGWTDSQVDKIVAGLCSPGRTVRNLALKLISAYAEGLEPAQRCKVWTALGFVMDRYEEETAAIQHEFFNVIRGSEMPASLTPMVDSFACAEHSDVSMARDFTSVFLARALKPYDGVGRLAEMLWSDSPSLSGGAASNLIVLASHEGTSHELAWAMVNTVLDVLLERAGESRQTTKMFLKALAYLDRLHPEVIRYCEEAVATGESPQQLYTVARILGVIPWDVDETGNMDRVMLLLQDLCNSPHERVARVAHRLLE